MFRRISQDFQAEFTYSSLQTTRLYKATVYGTLVAPYNINHTNLLVYNIFIRLLDQPRYRHTTKNRTGSLLKYSTFYGPKHNSLTASVFQYT